MYHDCRVSGLARPLPESDTLPPQPRKRNLIVAQARISTDTRHDPTRGRASAAVTTETLFVAPHEPATHRLRWARARPASQESAPSVNAVLLSGRRGNVAYYSPRGGECRLAYRPR